MIIIDFFNWLIEIIQFKIILYLLINILLNLIVLKRHFCNIKLNYFLIRTSWTYLIYLHQVIKFIILFRFSCVVNLSCFLVEIQIWNVSFPFIFVVKIAVLVLCWWPIFRILLIQRFFKTMLTFRHFQCRWMLLLYFFVHLSDDLFMSKLTAPNQIPQQLLLLLLVSLESRKIFFTLQNLL